MFYWTKDKVIQLQTMTKYKVKHTQLGIGIGLGNISTLATFSFSFSCEGCDKDHSCNWFHCFSSFHKAEWKS